jgi:drug/metabolite transporter (DMT)-like permease
MIRSSANGRGIVAMIGSTACFSANDAATKVAVKWIPATEIMALRGAFTLLFVLALIGWRGEFGRFAGIKDKFLVLRSGAEATTGLLIIIALGLMPLADVTAILLVQPFLLTIAGVLLFKEMVGWRRWGAVLVGFLGMLLVVKPGSTAFNAVSLLVILAAFLVVVRDVTTRWIATEVPTTMVVVVTAFMGVVIGGSGSLAGNWQTPNFEAFAAVVIAAAFFVFAIMLGVVAFRDTDVSVVAPFRYALVLFAVIYGILLFAEFPDALSLAGIGLIVGAGIYMLHREAVRQGQMRAARADAVAGRGRHP